MKKKLLGLLCCGILLVGLTGCGDHSSSISKKDIDDHIHQNYYKVNGKWYHK